MQQLALEISPPPDPTFDSYFPARNAAVVAALREALEAAAQSDDAARSGDRFLYLWGPPGSGKTHLLRAFVAEALALGAAARYFRSGEGIDAGDGERRSAIDDVDRLDLVGQLALFDLYNRIRAGSGVMVTAGACPPAELPLREDLRTRLGAGVVLRLAPLSDEEQAAAIGEHGRRRGLALVPELIEYLQTHVTRDMGTQMAVVDTLDRVSLERKRALTLPLLREVLRLLRQPTAHGR